MTYLGLTLGLIGSMHCIMMCGPLVLGVSRLSSVTGTMLYKHALSYNLGRITAYMILGLAFSMMGEALAVVGIQKAISLATGIILIILLMFSMNIERLLFRSSHMKIYYQKYQIYITSRIASMAGQRPISLGFLNGLIPCGMVYVALIGSLNAQSIGEGMLFMLGFGLGTLPVMFSIMVGAQKLVNLKQLRIKYAIPIGQFLLGVYLIFRGTLSDIPAF